MLTIGELARKGGVKPGAIRFYERTGIIPKPHRMENGYRLYATATADRIALIRKAQGLGLRLEEIREVLKASDDGRCACPAVEKAVRAKLEEVDARIRELRALKRQLSRVVDEPCEPEGKGDCVKPGCSQLANQPIRPAVRLRSLERATS